jgi:hypothetical protein
MMALLQTGICDYVALTVLFKGLKLLKNLNNNGIFQVILKKKEPGDAGLSG